MTFWRSRQAGGIALIVLATLSFASLDTSTKYATHLIPVLMLLWFRYVFQVITTLALRYPLQKSALLRTCNPRFQVLRGVLLVRPGGQLFGLALVFPVGLVASYAWFQVLASRLSGEENPYTTHFYTGLVGAMVLSPVMFFTRWKPELLLSYGHWFLIVGFLGTFGHLMLIRAYMRTSAPVLTPYLYTQIGFATLGGWLVFDHVPDLFAWAGIATIAVSGVGNTLLTMAEVSQQARLSETVHEDV